MHKPKKFLEILIDKPNNLMYNGFIERVAMYYCIYTIPHKMNYVVYLLVPVIIGAFFVSKSQ